MHNPLRGVVTAEHQDHGGYLGHYGRDIGTRDAKGNWIYGVGQPVYAAFAGRASHIVRWSTRGNSADTWAPGRTGNGLRITNPDGEVQGYNHMTPVAGLKNKDWIAQGQLIGHLDLSGNMTAPHLHLETWANQHPSSHFSPKILFDKYGVNTMDNPATTSTASTPAKKESWFQMATKSELRTIVREEIARRSSWGYKGNSDKDAWAILRNIENVTEALSSDIGKKVWGHKNPHTDTDIYAFLRATHRQVMAAQGERQGLLKALEQISTGKEVNLDEIRKATEAGVSDALGNLEADVTLHVNAGDTK